MISQILKYTLEKYDVLVERQGRQYEASLREPGASGSLVATGRAMTVAKAIGDALKSIGDDKLSQLASSWGKKGGEQTSEAKAQANRDNAAKPRVR